MYCKQCGRKLRNEARFCDHCGTSTKDIKETKTTKTTKSTGTSSGKTSSGRTSSGRTGTQKNSRTVSDYEKNKRKRELERQKVRRNRKIAVFVVLIALVASAALGFATYNKMKPENEVDTGDSVSVKELLEEDQGEGEETESTEEPEATEKSEKDKKDAKDAKDVEDEDGEEDKESKPSPEPETEKEDEEKVAKKDYSEIAEECNIYKDDRMDDISCPYPKSFEQGSKANKNTVISLVDPLNDGFMMICAEVVGTTKSASALMNAYAEGLGVKLTDSDSGDNWYEVSFERNKKVNHRKAVIENGLCVYYDFSYDVDSAENETYNDYIDYMDHYLEQEAASFIKKEKSKE